MGKEATFFTACNYDEAIKKAMGGLKFANIIMIALTLYVIIKSKERTSTSISKTGERRFSKI